MHFTTGFQCFDAQQTLKICVHDEHMSANYKHKSITAAKMDTIQYNSTLNGFYRINYSFSLLLDFKLVINFKICTVQQPQGQVQCYIPAYIYVQYKEDHAQLAMACISFLLLYKAATYFSDHTEMIVSYI